MFVFIGNNAPKTTSPPFDLTSYRQFRVQSVLNGDLPEIKPILKRLRRLGESRAGSSNYRKEKLQLTDYVVKRWQFNPTITDKELARIIREKQKYASKSGDTFLVPDSNIGEDMPAELAFDSVNHAENIDSVERNYKFLLKGVKKLTDVVDNDSRSGIAMKTLYTAWLHMVNDNNVRNFINPLGTRAVGNTYANTMGPNKLVNKYTSQNTNEEPLQIQLKNSLEAYIHANSGDRGIKYRYDTFMKDLLSLFNTSLDCGILTSKESYNEIDIESELKEMEGRFPNGKFTEEFIDSTTTIEDWNLFKPEDLNNEFGIKEYTIDSVVGESLLEPVGHDRKVELVAEEDSLRLAKVFSQLKMGKEAAYFDKIYRKRMEALKKNEETYLSAKKVEDSINPILPAFLASKKRDSMGFGVILNKEMIDLGTDKIPDVDDATKEYLIFKLKSKVHELAVTFDKLYRRYDWSIKTLQEFNSFKKIWEDIAISQGENNGIITIMGKEFDLDLRFENNSNIDNQFTAMTTDFLIITADSFIVPELVVDEVKGCKYLNVKDSIKRDRN